MEMEHGLVGDVGGLEELGGGKVVDRRKFPHQRAGLDHQGIEVDGKDPIDEAVLHELGDGDVGPVDLGLVHELGNQIPPRARRKLCHAVGIGLVRRPSIGRRIARLDLLHEVGGGGDARCDRAARADEQGAFLVLVDGVFKRPNQIVQLSFFFHVGPRRPR